MKEAATLTFEPVTISTGANLWWARVPADINQDGILDIVLQDNNGHGGWLGWLEGNTSGEPWKTHIIAEKGPGGSTFACGDMDAGDFDLDGDIDILGFEHPGEWESRRLDIPFRATALPSLMVSIRGSGFRQMDRKNHIQRSACCPNPGNF